MNNSHLIIPRKLQGFWELMPKQQMLFSSFLNTIENTFKENCFVPLDTPVLEYSETLLAKSGGDTDKEVYRFTKGSTDMCMRYDLTVPLARFVAMHKEELNFPFKRYQIGKVYRGENFINVMLTSLEMKPFHLLLMQNVCLFLKNASKHSNLMLKFISQTEKYLPVSFKKSEWKKNRQTSLLFWTN